MNRAKSLIENTLARFGRWLIAHRPDGGVADEVSLAATFPDFSPEALQVIERCTPYTMTSAERLYMLYQAANYVCQHQVPGAIVECGVWRGGSMMAAALTLLRHGDKTRELYLYDTFEGMTEAEDVDRDFRGHSGAMLHERHIQESSENWCLAGLDEVKRNLAAVGYPEDRIRYVQGEVEDTIPGTVPDEIALLRLDTDWYQSTRHEMEHLFPRLRPGGVLIIDDYGHWQGARKAVDEYLAAHGLQMLLCRVDYTARIAVKQ